MKTYQQFLEVTSADIRAMGGNEKQMKILRDRQKARGGSGMGQKGSTGSHMHQKQDKKGGTLATRPSSALATRPSSALARAADKGSAIVKHKNQIDKDREANKAQAKQRLASGSAGTPKRSPINRRENQFKSGVKSALGGDAFAKTDSLKRRAARKELGKKTVGAAKSLAGKALGALASNKPPSKIEKATPLSLTPGGVNSKYSK